MRTPDNLAFCRSQLAVVPVKTRPRCAEEALRDLHPVKQHQGWRRRYHDVRGVVASRAGGMPYHSGFPGNGTPHQSLSVNHFPTVSWAHDWLDVVSSDPCVKIPCCIPAHRTRGPYRSCKCCACHNLFGHRPFVYQGVDSAPLLSRLRYAWPGSGLSPRSDQGSIVHLARPRPTTFRLFEHCQP